MNETAKFFLQDARERGYSDAEIIEALTCLLESVYNQGYEEGKWYARVEI